MLQIKLLAAPQGQVSWFLLHFLRGSSTIHTHQHLRLFPTLQQTYCRDLLVASG